MRQCAFALLTSRRDRLLNRKHYNALYTRVNYSADSRIEAISSLAAIRIPAAARYDPGRIQLLSARDHAVDRDGIELHVSARKERPSGHISFTTSSSARNAGSFSRVE